MFSKRKQLTLSAVLLISCFVALGFLWRSSSFLIFAFTTRTAALYELTDRTVPLIAAIEQNKMHLGVPPKTLEELVPKYIERVPETGIAMPDRYDYEVLEQKHRWQLSILCSRGMLNWDEFIYRPSPHNYSDVGGGWVEPMGTWGYLHE